MIPRRVMPCLVALALVASAFTLLGPTALGQEDPDPKSASQLRGAIGEASAQEAAALAELRDVQSRRSVLEARARELDAQVRAAAGRVEAAEREVARIAAEEAALQLEIDRLQAEIDASRQDFEDAAASLYRNAGNGGVLTVLEYARDSHSIVSADRYLRDVSDSAQDHIDRFDALKDEIDHAKEELEEQRAKAEEARDVAAAERANVERLRAEAEPARAAAQAEEATESQLLSGIQTRKAEFEAQYASLLAEQQALAGGVSRGSGNGRLKWPCDGDVVSGFGYRTHPISGTRRMHTGLDIGCANGAPIGSAGDGVVVEAGSRGGYGLAVVVDHGDGLATLYAHQSRIAASPGQRVGTGEVVGYVGSTGYSTGPHLHWEVWVNGSPVDPMGYA